MKKFIVIEVTPMHLKCIGIFANEGDAARCAAIWNTLQSGLNSPEKIYYKMLAVDIVD